MARAGPESRLRAGGFDIVLTDDGGTFCIAGFSVETTLASAMGMAFTAAETLTDAALSGHGRDVPRRGLRGGRRLHDDPGGLLNPGDILGMVHATFSVAADVSAGGVVPSPSSPAARPRCPTTTATQSCSPPSAARSRPPRPRSPVTRPLRPGLPRPGRMCPTNDRPRRSVAR